MRPLNLTDFLLMKIASALCKKDAASIWKEYDEQRPKTAAKTEAPEEDVEEIYDAYPTRDPRNGNRSLGKCAKDKQRIRVLLRQYTKEDILLAIESEIKENEDAGKWLKNFSTFLNNLPVAVSEGRLNPVDVIYQ